MDRLVGRGDSGPEGKLVHIFQTGTPQTQALASMNFSEEVIAQHVSAKIIVKTLIKSFIVVASKSHHLQLLNSFHLSKIYNKKNI